MRWLLILVAASLTPSLAVAQIARTHAELPSGDQPVRRVPTTGYTLSLIWTPEHCYASQRHPRDGADPECSGASAHGFTLRYAPQCGVVHRTYAVPDEVKPLQATGGVRTNLCLRARYGGTLSTLRGLALLGAEILAPQDFAGRRRGMIRAFTGFVSQWRHFRRTRVAATTTFAPHFDVWNYEERRDGAFVPFRSWRGRIAS